MEPMSACFTTSTLIASTKMSAVARDGALVHEPTASTGAMDALYIASIPTSLNLLLPATRPGGPFEALSGTVTSWARFVTEGVHISTAYSTQMHTSQSDSSTFAFDLLQSANIPDQLRCFPPEILLSWTGSYLIPTAVDYTRISLGPFHCPILYQTVRTQRLEDTMSAGIFCCPSQYDLTASGYVSMLTTIATGAALLKPWVLEPIRSLGSVATSWTQSMTYSYGPEVSAKTVVGMNFDDKQALNIGQFKVPNVNLSTSTTSQAAFTSYPPVLTTNSNLIATSTDLSTSGNGDVYTIVIISTSLGISYVAATGASVSDTSSTTTTQPLGVVIGVSVGMVALTAGLVVVGIMFWLRSINRQRRASSERESAAILAAEIRGANEMMGHSELPRREELDGTGKAASGEFAGLIETERQKLDGVDVEKNTPQNVDTYTTLPTLRTSAGEQRFSELM